MTEKSAYPVKASFVYHHLYGSCVYRDSEKMKICESITKILNESYSAGKNNRQCKNDRKAAYLRKCKGLMVKAGLVQYVSNRRFYMIMLKMINEAYTVGFNEGKEA